MALSLTEEPLIRNELKSVFVFGVATFTLNE